MDTRTGEIAPLDHFRRTLSPREIDEFVRPVELGNLPAAVRIALARTSLGKIGRNDSCPCGSRKRFKSCCMNPATQAFA